MARYEWYYDFPRPFHGILSKYNLDELNEKDVFDLYISKGIFLNYNSKYKRIKKVNSVELTMKDKFYNENRLNPILRYEFLNYVYEAILFSMIDTLDRFNLDIENQLKYQLNIKDKLSFIKKQKKKIFKKINKHKHFGLFSLYHSEEHRSELIFYSWLVAVDEIIGIIPSKPKYEVSDEIIDYLTSKDKYTPNPFHLKRFYTWEKFEVLIHKLELIKSIEMDLQHSIDPFKNKKTISNQSNNDTTFLELIKPILKTDSDIVYFQQILMLNEEKNIPFFTAIFNFFNGQEGGRTKLLLDDRPKNFIKIVNKSYDLNMTRLIHETGLRPNRLKELFRKIYEEN